MGIQTVSQALDYEGRGSPYGFKNRIINGAMVINQRATSLTASGYTVDRWYYEALQTSKGTAAQSTSIYPTGFLTSLGFTSSSAYTVGASENFGFQQPIEGFNFYDLGWGTANAKTITLSFWVYSSLTGTFGGALRNSGGTRSYPFSYTISTASTWEYKTVTIAGDTIGTWVGATNGVGVFLQFSLGAGATVSGTAGSWVAGNYLSATGATSVVGTNGATFYITGVQLEKGTQATAFDYRDYGNELRLCQRYFITDLYVWVGGGATPVATNRNFASVTTFPVTMRSTPVITKTGTETLSNMNAGTFDSTTAQRTRYIATNNVTNDAYAYTTFNAAIEL